MQKFAHQRSWTRHFASAGILCALAALSGCTSRTSSDGSISSSSILSARTYSLGATISGLNSSGHVLMVDATAVSVAAGTTTQRLVSSIPAGTSYSVAVQTQPT